MSRSAVRIRYLAPIKNAFHPIKSKVKRIFCFQGRSPCWPLKNPNKMHERSRNHQGSILTKPTWIKGAARFTPHKSTLDDCPWWLLVGFVLTPTRQLPSRHRCIRPPTPKAKNYPLWAAQYKKQAPTTYTDKPWTDSKGFGAWNNPLIYQYSSVGRLNGYKNNLDLDICYLTPDEWISYTKGTQDLLQPVRPTLRRGDKNEYVRAWQEYLNANGYCCGNADSVFGQKTQDALVKWQQDRGMESGYVGQKSWELLDS